MSDGAPILRAVRGAITVPEDTPEAIREGTTELLREMLHRNALAPGDLVSILFTTTEDLVSEFPAVAARHIGLGAVPIRHAYLRDARQLRMDLPE